jgi:hypothetical protein
MFLVLRLRETKLQKKYVPALGWRRMFFIVFRKNAAYSGPMKK